MIDSRDCAGLVMLGEMEPWRLDRMLTGCRVADCAAGDIILARGDVNETLFFLLAGEVHIHFELDDRAPPIVVPTGQMFGHMSVIDELPVSAFVRAACACRILLVPAAVFWTEIVTVPSIARQVMRSLSALVRRNNEALEEAWQERLRHEAFARELALAREIQMGMIRHTDPWFPGAAGFSIAAFLEPARLVGGDFHDAFLLDPDHLVVAVGDVAGKGISAALFMVRALTLLRSARRGWVSLAATAPEVNEALAADNDAGMFLTMFMAVLDLRTGEVEYVNFGHPPPLLVTAEGSAAFQPVPAGTVLGTIPLAQGALGRLVLTPGTTVVIYSDGVTEAMDPALRQFGEAGLLAAASGEAATPDALVQRIVAATSAHAGTAEQADDITLLAVTWHG